MPVALVRPFVRIVFGFVAPLGYSATSSSPILVTQRFPFPSIAQNAGVLTPSVIVVVGTVLPRRYSEIQPGPLLGSLVTYKVPRLSIHTPAGSSTPLVMVTNGFRSLPVAPNTFTPSSV